MRKAFLLSAVAGVALFASSAMADVFVDGNVAKTVSVEIDEVILKTKTVAITVAITDEVDAAAEATTLYNQRNQDNFACENCAEKLDRIIDSINGNTGITSVNQASGNNNNQATVVSFAYDLPVEEDPPGDPGPGDPINSAFAHAQTAGAQYMVTNTIETINIVFRDAVINNSVNTNIGITAVNQSAGNINNQANGVAIAVALPNGVALADTALGQFNTSNIVDESNVSKRAAAINSINANIGVTQVNQTAGNMGNQSNTVTIAVSGVSLF